MKLFVYYCDPKIGALAPTVEQTKLIPTVDRVPLLMGTSFDIYLGGDLLYVEGYFNLGEQLAYCRDNLNYI